MYKINTIYFLSILDISKFMKSFIYKCLIIFFLVNITLLIFTRPLYQRLDVYSNMINNFNTKIIDVFNISLDNGSLAINEENKNKLKLLIDDIRKDFFEKENVK